MISVSFPNKSTLLLHNFKCTERAFNEEVNVRSFFSVINNRINIVFFSRIKYLPRRNGKFAIIPPEFKGECVTHVTLHHLFLILRLLLALRWAFIIITCTSSWLYVIPISDLTVASTHSCIIYFQGKYYLKPFIFRKVRKGGESAFLL